MLGKVTGYPPHEHAVSLKGTQTQSGGALQLEAGLSPSAFSAEHGQGFQACVALPPAVVTGEATEDTIPSRAIFAVDIEVRDRTLYRLVWFLCPAACRVNS